MTETENIMRIKRASSVPDTGLPLTRDCDDAEGGCEAAQSAHSQRLTCEWHPVLRSGVLPITQSPVIFRLYDPLLAYGVGDLLEFNERARLGSTSRGLHRALAAGTRNPLYRGLFAAEALLRQAIGKVDEEAAAWVVIHRARGDIRADRSARAAALQAERQREAEQAAIRKEAAARAAFAAARTQHAAQTARKLAANPRSLMLLSESAQLLADLGRADDAVRVIERCLALYPDDRYSLGQLARTLMQAGRPQEAADAATRLIALSPDDSCAKATLARAWLLQGDAARAASCLDGPGQVGDPVTLAMILHSLGRFEEGEPAMRRITCDGPLAQGKLAELHVWQGNMDAAFVCLERVMRRNLHDKALWNAVHSPFMAALRADPQWPAFARRIGRSAEQLAAISFEFHPPAQ